MPNYSPIESRVTVITVIWIVPALIALVLALIVCMAIGINGFYFPAKYLLAMSKDLITFLGIITAILIAVFASVYVQSRGNQVTGFDIFFRSLSAFKNLIPEIDEMDAQSNQRTFEDWGQQAISFAKKLNRITPGWQGYDAHPKFEDELLEYAESSKRWTRGAIGQWEDFSIRHDDHIKGILIGLRLMDEGTIEVRLVSRLRRVFFSLVTLLVLSLIIRALAEPSIIISINRLETLNLILYVFLPSVAIAHLLALAHAIWVWRRDMNKRDREWAS